MQVIRVLKASSPSSPGTTTKDEGNQPYLSPLREPPGRVGATSGVSHHFLGRRKRRFFVGQGGLSLARVPPELSSGSIDFGTNATPCSPAGTLLNLGALEPANAAVTGSGVGGLDSGRQPPYPCIAPAAASGYKGKPRWMR